jgi:hypothetical protein
MNTSASNARPLSAWLNASRRLALKWAAAATLGASLLGMSACSTIDPAIYANEKPKFDLKSYFNGTVDAWGVVTDRNGKVIKRFTVVLDCKWTGDTGVLDESFTYSDGTKDKRIWTLKKNGDRYIGTASDVVGEATGIASGNALLWSYTMALPVDGKVYNVKFEDWMFLMDDEIMINRAEMRFYGFKTGEITLSFRKRK